MRVIEVVAAKRRSIRDGNPAFRTTTGCVSLAVRQPRVLGKIDLTHAAIAEQAHDPVMQKLQDRLEALKVKANAADQELATAMRAAVGDDTPQNVTGGGGGGDDTYHPVTAEQLRKIVPELSEQRAAEIVGPLNDAMRQGGEVSPL